MIPIKTNSKKNLWEKDGKIWNKYYATWAKAMV